MSKANFITYNVELTEANVPVIEQINTILIPGYDKDSETPSTTDKSAGSSSPKSSPKKITMSALKKAVTAAKKAHGIDFVNECIENAGGATGETLAKNVATIDQDDWSSFITALEAGPTESDDDDLDHDDLDLDDDDLDDEEDDDDLDADVVKTAVRAYASENGRDEAKAVMKKHKVGSLSDIDDLSFAKLTKLLKAVA